MNRSYLIKEFVNLGKKIDQFGVRERIFVLLTSLCLVYSLWQNLVFDSISDLKQKLSGNANKIQQEISHLQGQISQVSNTLSLDPFIRLKEKIKKTKQDNDDLQKKLVNLTDNLIPPGEMTAFLKRILENSNLKMISMTSIPPEPLFSRSNNSNDEEDEKEIAKEESLRFQVYKHGVEVVFSGTFFQLRDFLIDAEKLPWKVMWEELDFSVEQYPVANIKLVIKTLSINSDFLGTS